MSQGNKLDGFFKKVGIMVSKSKKTPYSIVGFDSSFSSIRDIGNFMLNRIDSLSRKIYPILYKGNLYAKASRREVGILIQIFNYESRQFFTTPKGQILADKYINDRTRNDTRTRGGLTSNRIYCDNELVFPKKITGKPVNSSSHVPSESKPNYMVIPSDTNEYNHRGYTTKESLNELRSRLARNMYKSREFRFKYSYEVSAIDSNGRITKKLGLVKYDDRGITVLWQDYSNSNEYIINALEGTIVPIWGSTKKTRQ